jgi:methionyl-tRNA synthetase
MSKGFYLTTAIFYVNGEPHLGHAYEMVIADVIARSRRSLGQETFFLTGLDEHGQKVQQTAIAAGKSPQEYCNDLAVTWREFARRLDLSNDDFIRTSEPRHKQVVRTILSKLHREGHFYKAQYKGFYSARQETFLTDKDRLPDGTFDPFYGEVVELIEDNYWFGLKDHQAWLIEYIESHPEFIHPSQRRNEVLGFLRSQPLEDLCISRPTARLSWGIPLPFDESFVTYVWFDALVNYLTAPFARGDWSVIEVLDSTATESKRRQPDLPLWPADIHVIGKDILKFHAVYWPIMLKAMGLPLPRQVLTHGWWQKDGQRMSKSTGNVIDPTAVINEWGVDAFRYYVVRELDIGPDGNWTDAGFAARYKAELADGVGNLLNRSLSMLHRYRNGVVPNRSEECAAEVATAVAGISAELKQHRLQAALVGISALVARVNQYIDQTAPFKLAKDPAQSPRLDVVLYNMVEACRILAVLLWPFIPTTAVRIYEQLALSESPDRMATSAWGGLKTGHRIGQPLPLFPRKDSPTK